MISRFRFFLRLTFTGFLPAMLFSCGKPGDIGKIIVTRVPVSEGRMDLSPVEKSFSEKASLVMIDLKRSSSQEVLTDDFYSACSPDVSWDGTVLVFAGQKKENDTWQIWKMDLKKREVSQVTNDTLDCTDPVYLPTGRILFSKSVHFSHADAIELFSVNSDGSDLRQLTFHPHINLASSILTDGRILSVTHQILPYMTGNELMITRPDGTKADLFYPGNPGSHFISKARQSDDGKIFFIEADTTGQKGAIFSVNYNRPLYTLSDHTGKTEGSFIAVFPSDNRKLLVSYRENENETYGLYEYDTELRKTGSKLYGSEDMNVIDVLPVREQLRPKKLPSEVDLGVKTGLLLCQDINFIGMGLERDPAMLSHRIEIAGVDSTMGMVNVEKDGSFYLKVIADNPFRVRKLDKNNKVIDESGWIWLRPNERRGCIGCHENPELSPENRVPLSIKKDPVSVPVHVSGILEKEVELE